MDLNGNEDKLEFVIDICYQDRDLSNLEMRSMLGILASCIK